ncbi:hypothetical protein MKW94_027764 [Papaver nudicaule]|uniref:Phosphatidylinositol transfer protein N-terminal domain-containing protein n=1 Tax=Papaver nudicaule TaxID=74823 RepID=A0AA41RNZ2_PAPNU|nr:hypothetical protein [Papaver nudicaule]
MFVKFSSLSLRELVTFQISIIVITYHCNLHGIYKILQCPYFERFSLSIETIHKADNGNSENVHGLSKEQLASREVVVIDIASTVRDYWSYAVGTSHVDLSKFKSLRTNRGPLMEGWQDSCEPVMTAYKLVKVDVPYWGFGYRLEQALLSAERALFLESHRNCFAWIDEWFGMTVEQIRELEKQSDSALNEKLGKLASADEIRRLNKNDSDKNMKQLN